MNGEHGLRVEKLCVARGGKRILHDVDITIRPGTIVALLGANGAGKSSLVLAMAGALSIEGGDVVLDGRSIRKMRPENVRRIGVVAVPEGHHVLGALTVRENLEAAGSMFDRAGLAAGIDRALATFPELREKLAASAGDLSGGQQQILALAQAIIARPKYLLADELSFGLAPVIVARLVPVLVQLARDGVGVLLIEQFTTVALRIATEACVMERGRLVFTGSPETLARNPEILHTAYL